MQIIIFTLGKEKFGLETNLIDGIEKMLSITKVPTASDYIRGLANLRGNIIPVIDLKSFLNMEYIKEEENIIILEVAEDRIGVMVDDVHEVVEISDDMIERVTDNNGFVKGVVNFKEYLVTLLEGEKLASRWEG